MKSMIHLFWREPLPLILASSSAIRQALLRAAGFPVEIVPSGIDEKGLIGAARQTVDPALVAAQLARAKTIAVSRLNIGRIVLGADQTLSLDGRLFTKPADHRTAAKHLSLLSGREHQLHSAIAIARNGCVLEAALEHASLRMRELSPSFIANYLTAAGDAALNSVGCYQLEGLGIHLFRTIKGDHSTILGLPLMPLLQCLRHIGCIAE
jgi:septum formation protein